MRRVSSLGISTVKVVCLICFPALTGIPIDLWEEDAEDMMVFEWLLVASAPDMTALKVKRITRHGNLKETNMPVCR
jgi:hypothetical protein